MPADKAGNRTPGQDAGRTALQARIAYESAHPEIAITSPLTSRSGQWELTTVDGTATFSAVQAMLDFLGTRFGAADGG